MSLRALHFILAAALAATAVPVSAQSLAEVARREQERRKGLTETGKAYSNKDLEPVPLSSSDVATPNDAAVADAPAADTAQPDTTADAGAAAAAATLADTDSSKDQAYWRGRMGALEGQLARDQAFADALQVQIDALSTDFVNRDDPAQRAVISNNRQKALDELARLRKSIEDARNAVADLEDEARRAAVPPGWLR